MVIEVRKRHPVSPKRVRQFNDLIEGAFGVRPVPEDAIVELADADPYEFLMVDGKVIAVTQDPSTDRAYPGLQAILADLPERGWVTVDMGAIPFVTNGADIMAPGITDADPDITEGDLVWVRDETHGRPLAIGVARASGPDMASGSSGKVIGNLHYVGDEIWDIGRA